ncbi:hypothetical protein GJR88_04186 [Dietzia sp. DQ12-45-1b]|nr:hypothetical protein GJR88_04186 [Dietzia sp. DQ12-45-1b]
MSDHKIGRSGPMAEGVCGPLASPVSERRMGTAATGVSR